MNRLDAIFGDNFKIVEKGIDTRPFLEELTRNDQLWERKNVDVEKFQPNDLTRGMPLLHRHSFHIYLRGYQRTNLTKGLFYGDVARTMKSSKYRSLPSLTAWMEDFAKRHHGRLGRAYVSNIPPGKQVYRHWDAGLYYVLRNRYHLVLQSDGNRFTSGSQWAILKQGNVYWFNNKLGHEAFNESAVPRIHLIFDLLPDSLVMRMKNAVLAFYSVFARKVLHWKTLPATDFVNLA